MVTRLLPGAGTQYAMFIVGWIGPFDECWPSLPLLSGAKLFCSQLPDSINRLNCIAAAALDNGLFQALSSLFHSGYSGSVLKTTVSFYRAGVYTAPCFLIPLGKAIAGRFTLEEKPSDCGVACNSVISRCSSSTVSHGLYATMCSEWCLDMGTVNPDVRTTNLFFSVVLKYWFRVFTM